MQKTERARALSDIVYHIHIRSLGFFMRAARRRAALADTAAASPHR